MNIHYLCVDGASASSRSEVDRLERIVFGCTGHTARIVQHSTWKSRTYNTLDRYFSVFPNNAILVIVCKSQGAWRVLDYLKRNFKKLFHLDIRVVSIDPHHWADGVQKLIGVKNPKAVFKTVNIYQKKEWPCGYYVPDAHNILIRDISIDHWNIIHEESVKAAIVGSLLEQI